MKIVLNVFFVVLLSALLQSFPAARACLHFPRTYKQTLKEGKQEAFLFHDGKNAHLIVRTQLQANSLPSEVSWVLPFPSLPSHYEEVDGSIFEELFQLSPDPASYTNAPTRGMQKGVTDSVGSILVHPVQIVGNYKIEPIEIIGSNNGSGNEFNTWLTKNNFNPMPLDLQKRYLKKGAVFLAIRMSTQNLSEIQVKPLHIVYPSKVLSIPLKFTHDGRTFDLDLYVFSRSLLASPDDSLELLAKKLPTFASAFLYPRGIGSYANTASKGHPQLQKILGAATGFVTRFEGRGFNGPGKSLAQVAADPQLSAAELSH